MLPHPQLVTSGTSDVVITSVISEKTRQKKLIIIIITEKTFTSKWKKEM